ncbi:MAG: hypothetical protein WCS65_04040 [Verrucomicrobiae bacterium]
MKKLILFLCAAGLLSAQDAPPPSATPRSRALELAGAFANDGYKIRDGFWAGTLEPGKPQFLAVNLFSGNEYWFSAAVLTPAAKLSVALFDDSGRPVDVEVFQDGAAAAAGFVPAASGKYFVKLGLVGGEKTEFCLVYSYK